MCFASPVKPIQQTLLYTVNDFSFAKHFNAYMNEIWHLWYHSNVYVQHAKMRFSRLNTYLENEKKKKKDKSEPSILTPTAHRCGIS